MKNLFNLVRNEDATYEVKRHHLTDAEVINMAKDVLASSVRETNGFTEPAMVKRHVVANCEDNEVERSTVLCLDSQHRLLGEFQLQKGRINAKRFNAKKLVKETLAHEAAAVIVVHYQPGDEERPDAKNQEGLVQLTKSTLAVLDVSVLDVFIANKVAASSLAELGLL